MFGNCKTKIRGNVLKCYASIRIDIRRIRSIKDKNEVVSNQTRVKVVKNKVSLPFEMVKYDIIYGQSIFKKSELIDLRIQNNFVEKFGTWFSYNNTRIR